MHFQCIFLSLFQKSYKISWERILARRDLLVCNSFCSSCGVTYVVEPCLGGNVSFFSSEEGAKPLLKGKKMDSFHQWRFWFVHIWGFFFVVVGWWGRTTYWTGPKLFYLLALLLWYQNLWVARSWGGTRKGVIPHFLCISAIFELSPTDHSWRWDTDLMGFAVTATAVLLLENSVCSFLFWNGQTTSKILSKLPS